VISQIDSPNLIERLARLLYPPVQAHELSVRDASTRHHARQLARRCHPEVESAIVAKHEWAANFNKPGKYVYEGRA
jgi:hypothetical protein